MKLFKTGWILRIDPKDPRARLGSDLEVFVQFKHLKDAWCRDGIPVRHWGFDSADRVQVKWVFKTIIIGVFRNKEIAYDKTLHRKELQRNTEDNSDGGSSEQVRRKLVEV